MSTTLILAVATLSSLGVALAAILYFIAEKFKVFEDPRIDQVTAILPGANCGGCGFPGCRGLAEAIVHADGLDHLLCPVGGDSCMHEIAGILGHEATTKTAMVAVVRCNGTQDARKKVRLYNGAPTCAVAASTCSGETECCLGCLGFGDCEVSCLFNAIKIDPITNLPVVDQQKCTACGACTKACPKGIIEMRFKGVKDRRIYVSCINKDKGNVARKACTNACIGCSRCLKSCPFDAITVESNLAYINFQKCRLCRKCVAECPTGAIWEVNFPANKANSESTKTFQS